MINEDFIKLNDSLNALACKLRKLQIDAFVKHAMKPFENFKLLRRKNKYYRTYEFKADHMKKKKRRN